MPHVRIVDDYRAFLYPYFFIFRTEVAFTSRNKKDFRVALEFTEAALARYRIIYGITPMETLETERIAKELRHICDLAVSE